MDISRRWHAPAVFAVPLAFAALKLLLHALAVTNYGYFRDELYYIACSKHLAWGYVDQPPFSIAVLAGVRAVLGDSLWALRLLPALSGAATVVLVGVIATDLGGGRRALALACLCAVLAPVWLAVDHFYSMNAFDTLFWTLAAWLLLKALDNGRPRTWVALGAALGLGLLNKTSMLWFGGAAAFGLAVTSHRRVLRTPWPWAAAAIAAAGFAPHVLWQWQNGWPTLEFVRNATSGKMIRTGIAAFWLQQLLVMNPASAPVWMAGLAALLWSRRTRVLGLAFVGVAALLCAGGSSRPNYLAVAYAPLFAAGGVALERAAAARGRAWLGPAAIAAVTMAGAPVVPMGLPFLPVDRQVAYTGALSLRPRAQERTREGDLPQIFADMFGWEELVQRVARVYHALPADQRAKCAIFATNYGEAGAIDFFGPRYGLPPAISPHNNYWLWGPRGATGEVVIIVGGNRAEQHSDFQSAVLADTTNCGHCMPFENGAPIFVCLGLNKPLSRRWLEIRNYQ
jgi:4-amino-4-deoxy-L-arabinose transferase-like glycosyltransferase